MRSLPAEDLVGDSETRSASNAQGEALTSTAQLMVSFLRVGGMACKILSALTLSSTFKVRRYFEVLSLNFVMPFLLFFLIVIFSATGRLLFSLRKILMNSFRSLISLGYNNKRSAMTKLTQESSQKQAIECDQLTILCVLNL